MGEFFLVEPCAHTVLGQADVVSPSGTSRYAPKNTGLLNPHAGADGVTVRAPQGDDMGVAEACPEPVEGKTSRGCLVSVMSVLFWW